MAEHLRFIRNARLRNLTHRLERSRDSPAEPRRHGAQHKPADFSHQRPLMEPGGSSGSLARELFGHGPDGELGRRMRRDPRDRLAVCQQVPVVDLFPSSTMTGHSCRGGRIRETGAVIAPDEGSHDKEPSPLS
jgi:hypothetical protein